MFVPDDDDFYVIQDLLFLLILLYLNFLIERNITWL